MTHHEILPAALAEIEEAVSWYEEQREGLGLELLAEYRASLKRALMMPAAGTIVGRTPGGTEVRRFRLRRFERYGIMLASIHEVPTVVALAHAARRPGYWSARLGEADDP